MQVSLPAISMLGSVGGTIFLVYIIFKGVVFPFAKFGFRTSLLK